MPGPVLRDTTPDWLKPENASVFDSATTRAARAIAGWLGLTDPGQAVAAAAGPLMAAESKLEGPLGQVVERLGARARQLTGGFFSRVDEAAKQLPAKGAHANKVAAILKNNASAEELAYRGVPEWLAAQGNTPITPEALGAYLEAHPAPFPTVKTLAKTPDTITNWLERNNQGIPQTPDEWTRLSAQMERTAQGWQRHGDTATADRFFGFAEDAGRHAEGVSTTTGSTAGQPKFSQYTLPGGENYRENLLTLPPRGKDPHGFPLDTPAPGWGDIGTRPTDRSDLFRSAHFEEPNILVHTRANERTLPTGEPGRFVEEVQSDWHQAGKARGYQPTGADRAARQEELARAEAVHTANNDARHAALERLKWSDVRRGDPGWDPLMADYEAAERAANESWGVVEDLRKGLDAGVPDAPFKASWPELGLKQQLVEAAHDPAAEWLGFTSGNTQAERYDLSKQISRILNEPHEAGDYSLGTLYVYDTQGKQVLRESRLEPAALDEYIGKEPADKLRREIANHEAEAAQWSITRDPNDGRHYVVDPNGEYVGDGWSSRARAETELQDMRTGANQWEVRPDPTIEGLDLQVGGEGMREFYDRQLPRKLEKILKPLGGGPVERGSVRVPIGGGGSGPANSAPLGEAFFDTLAREGTIEGKVPIGSNQTLMSRDELGQAFASGALTPFHFSPTVQQRVMRGGVQEPIWMARLTPEMKQRIREEGLPLLQLVGGAALGGMTLDELHRRAPPAADWFDAQGPPDGATLKDLHTPQ